MQEPSINLPLQSKPQMLPRAAMPIFDLIWLVVAGLSIVMFVVGWHYRYLQLLYPPAEIAGALSAAGLSSRIWVTGMLGSETILMTVFTVVGVLLYFQRRKEVAIFVASLMLIIIGTGFLNVVDAFAEAYPRFYKAEEYQNALLWLLLLLFLYIFPNGKFEPAWTKWAFAGWVFFTLGWLIFPQSPHNPTRLGALSTPWVFLAYFAWIGSGVYAMVWRSLKTDSIEERQQTKWVVAGSVAAFFIAFLQDLPSSFNPTFLDHSTPQGVVYAIISTLIFCLGMLLAPLSIVYSIQKNRLWKIDYLINRGLVYGMMTLLVIVGLYGIFSVLHRILDAVIDVPFDWFSPLLSLLIVLYLFRPMSRWVQAYVDEKVFGIHIAYHHPVKKDSHSRVTEKAWTNSTVGRYQIGNLLRSGRSGRVYYGIESNTGKPVAVKFLHQHLAVLPEERKAFVAEAKTLSKLDHPNISKLLDYGEEDETTCYIVLEYISDQTLAGYLRNKGCLPLKDAQYLLSQLASAVDYAHRQNVIHLDIKPDNILLKPKSSHPVGFTPVLTDFGLSRKLVEKRDVYFSGVTGTFAYISPEQIHSPDRLDCRADIYSLGVVMYQMVTGRLPYQDQHAAATLIAHLHQPPPNPMEINPEVSLKTAHAIRTAMDKNPSSRFENASMFAQEI